MVAALTKLRRHTSQPTHSPTKKQTHSLITCQLPGDEDAITIGRCRTDSPWHTVVVFAVSSAELGQDTGESGHPGLCDNSGVHDFWGVIVIIRMIELDGHC